MFSDHVIKPPIMPEKSVITLTELIFLSTVWSACLNAWKPILSSAVTNAVDIIIPGLTRFRKEVIATFILFAALYALIFTFENVQVGKNNVWELK